MHNSKLTGLACLGLAVSLCLPGSSVAQERRGAMTDLLVSGLERPVRIRFLVTVGEKAWKVQADEAQKRYVQAVFEQLDSDKSGSLSADEARRFSAADTFAAKSPQDDVFVAFNYRVVDANDDSAVSQPEFAEYVERFGEIPLRLATVPQKSSSNDLFRFLDASRDRLLTKEEWTNTARALEQDRDGNRVLTPEELRGPVSAVTPPEFTAAPRAGMTKPLKFQLVPPGEAPADAEILIGYPDPAKGGPPEVGLNLGASLKDVDLRIESQSPGEVVLACHGHRMVFRIQPSGPAAPLDSARLIEAFNAAAEQAQGQVTAGTSLPPELKSLFPLADANADGHLELAELQACVQRIIPARQAAASSRMRMVVFDEQPGLMGLADLNRDGRLSGRELKLFPEKMTAAAGDRAQLKREQVPATSIVVVQPGPFGAEPESDALQGAGPSWFVRADRNRDGDLDREEFLGSPEDFQKLDANRDGWIDPQEAVAAPIAVRQ